MLNNLIENIYLAGHSQALYNFFYILAIVLVCVYTFFTARRYRLPRWKSTLLTLLILGLGVGWIFVLCWADTGFKEFGGNNNVRGFIWYPVIAWLVCRLFKVPFKPLLELAALWPPMAQAIGHIGCIFAGCCHGYYWPYGIYNPITDTTLFPNQLLESVAAALICGVLILRQRRHCYRVDGLSYPLMLMLFGASRFFLEFLRDNNKLFWGISNLAIHAFVMFLVGVISYAIVRARNKRAAQTP